MKLAWRLYRVLFWILVVVVFIGPALVMVVVGDWLLLRASREVVIASIYLPMAILYVAVYRWAPGPIDRLDKWTSALLKPPG